jgi:hypothetical protein
MKATQKRQLSFGAVVMAAYQVWGSRLAAKMLKLAIKEKFVVFNGHPYSLGSSVKGRPV